MNRAVGNRLYPFKMPRGLKPGMGLYRNQDQAFDKELSGKTAERKIAIKMWFGTSPSPSKGRGEPNGMFVGYSLVRCLIWISPAYHLCFCPYCPTTIR